MSWSYDSSLSTARDHVRFLIQDTDTNDQLVSNEEISTTLTENGSNKYRAAAALCRSIALLVGRRPHVKESHGSLSSQEQYEHWMALAKEYDSKAAVSGSSSVGAGVYAGGISVADIDSRRADTDRPSSAFSTDLHNA